MSKARTIGNIHRWYNIVGLVITFAALIFLAVDCWSVVTDPNGAAQANLKKSALLFAFGLFLLGAGNLFFLAVRRIDP